MKIIFFVIPYLMRNPKSFHHFRKDKYFTGFPIESGMTLVLAEPVLAEPVLAPDLSGDRQAVARNEIIYFADLIYYELSITV